MKQLVYILIGFLLLSCGKRQEYREMLSRAEAVMNDHPDSALTMLDSLGIHETEFDKRFLRKYQLRRLQAENKTNVPLTSDSLAKILVSYYDSHGNANERMLAHYLLGCTYRDMGEAPHAIDCYLDATTQADTTAKDCDFYTLSCVYSQMAAIFHRQLLLSNEIETRKKASHYAYRAKNVFYAIYDMEKSVGAYILQNKRDSAERIMIKAIQQYQDNGYSQEALQVAINLLYLYTEQPNKIENIKEILRKVESEANWIKSDKILKPSQRVYYYYKGKYYLLTENLDSAESCFRMVYRPNMPITLQNSMYKGLLSVFQKRHITDSIAKYAQLYCEVNDSSIAKKDQDLTAQMAASYNYNRYQKEAIEKERKVKRLNNILFISIVTTISMAYILWRRHHNKIKKMKEEFTKAKNDYQNNLHTLELLDTTHKTIIETIQQELNQEIEASLSTRTKYDNAQKRLEDISNLYETDRQELLQEISSLKKKIENLKRSEAIYKYFKKTNSFLETDSVKHIKELINKPLEPIEDRDWNLLFNSFSLYYPALIQDLRNSPGITQQHIRTCMLTILEVRGLDIANKLNVKGQRITNIKSEVNHALFNENSARSLYKNLIDRYNICRS